MAEKMEYIFISKEVEERIAKRDPLLLLGPIENTEIAVKKIREGENIMDQINSLCMVIEGLTRRIKTLENLANGR